MADSPFESSEKQNPSRQQMTNDSTLKQQSSSETTEIDEPKIKNENPSIKTVKNDKGKRDLDSNCWYCHHTTNKEMAFGCKDCGRIYHSDKFRGQCVWRTSTKNGEVKRRSQRLMLCEQDYGRSKANDHIGSTHVGSHFLMNFDSKAQRKCSACSILVEAKKYYPTIKSIDLLNRHLLVIIKALFECEESEMFRKIEIFNYEEYVKTPIDIDKMKAKADIGAYNSAEEFLFDLTYLVHNCYVFNPGKSRIAISAHRLAKILFNFGHKNYIRLAYCYWCYNLRLKPDRYLDFPCYPNPHGMVWVLTNRDEKLIHDSKDLIAEIDLKGTLLRNDLKPSSFTPALIIGYRRTIDDESSTFVEQDYIDVVLFGSREVRTKVPTNQAYTYTPYPPGNEYVLNDDKLAYQLPVNVTDDLKQYFRKLQILEVDFEQCNIMTYYQHVAWNNMFVMENERFNLKLHTEFLEEMDIVNGRAFDVVQYEAERMRDVTYFPNEDSDNEDDDGLDGRWYCGARCVRKIAENEQCLYCVLNQTKIALSNLDDHNVDMGQVQVVKSLKKKKVTFCTKLWTARYFDPKKSSRSSEKEDTENFIDFYRIFHHRLSDVSFEPSHINRHFQIIFELKLIDLRNAIQYARKVCMKEDNEKANCYLIDDKQRRIDKQQAMKKKATCAKKTEERVEEPSKMDEIEARLETTNDNIPYITLFNLGPTKRDLDCASTLVLLSTPK